MTRGPSTSRARSGQSYPRLRAHFAKVRSATSSICTVRGDHPGCPATYSTTHRGCQDRSGPRAARAAKHGGRVFAVRSPKYPVRHTDRRGRVWTKQRRAVPAGTVLGFVAGKPDQIRVLVTMPGGDPFDAGR